MKKMSSTHLAIVATAFAIGISGCTTTKSGRVSYDADSRTTIVTGNETTISPLAGSVRTVFLKAEIGPDETELYLVVLYLSSNGWLAADQVSDSQGHSLRGLRGADESFDIKYGRVTKEIYYIPLTRGYLEAHRESGISVHLQGTKGAVPAVQPPAFVAGFLANLDAERKELAQGDKPSVLIAGRPKQSPLSSTPLKFIPGQRPKNSSLPTNEVSGKTASR